MNTDRPIGSTRDQIAELRVLATRALAECCDDCRAVLREQLVDEEARRVPGSGSR